VKVRDRIKELRRVPASELIPNPKNWRTHPVAQQDALKGVLAEIGYADALIARETPDGLMLVDGHLRAETTPDAEVPVLVLDINEAEADLMLATLDPLATMAGRDEGRLSELVSSLSPDSAAVSDLLNGMVENIDLEKDVPPDEDVFEIPSVSWVQQGDMFQLGRHRLLCGDSTDVESVEKLMGGAKGSLVHADPPYGMDKDFDNDNLHKENLDSFHMNWWNVWRPFIHDNASAYIWGNSADLWRLWHEGGLKDSERLTFRNEIVWDKGGGGMAVGTEAGRMFQSSERCLFFMLGEQGFNNNADNYWEGWEPIRSQLESDCQKMGWGPKDIKRICGVGMYSHWFTKSQWGFITKEHYDKLQAEAKGSAFVDGYDGLRSEYEELKGAKMGSPFQASYEQLRETFYNSRAYFDNSHEAMSDVWLYAPVNLSESEPASDTIAGDIWKCPRVIGIERYGHPTPKPVKMVIRVVKTSCGGEGLIVDPFSGTGTTIMASEYSNRACYAMEIEPRYCDVTIKRWEDYTGQKAVKV